MVHTIDEIDELTEEIVVPENTVDITDEEIDIDDHEEPVDIAGPADK